MLWVFLGVIVLVVAVRLLVEGVSVCAGFALFVLRHGFVHAMPGLPTAGAVSHPSPLDEPDDASGSDEHPPSPDDR